MIIQLDTENNDYDLTSQQTVLTDTPNTSNAILCQAIVFAGDGSKNLDGSGGDFELEITVDGNTVQPGPQIVTLGTSDTRACFISNVFPVPSNVEVVVKLKSPNVGDSDVDVTAYLYDVSVTPTNFEDLSIADTTGVVKANDANGNAVAVASVQPDNKPVVDVSGHTEVVKGDGSSFNDVSEAQVNAQCDQALNDAGVTSARMGYVDNLENHTAQSGDSFARLGAPSGDSVSADIASIKTDTGTYISNALTTIANYVDCLPETLDGSTFDSLPVVTTDSASRTASKANLSTLESRLNSDRAGWLDNLEDPNDFKADVSGLATSSALADVKADTESLLSRVSATLFNGITSLANWLRSLARSDEVDATAKSEINSGGGTWAETDTLQAIRDRGDTHWITFEGDIGSVSVDIDTEDLVEDFVNAILLSPENKIATDENGYVYTVRVSAGIEYGSGSYTGVYAYQEDIEFIYGATNIQKWADIDNDNDDAKIANRIAWALDVSESWINDRLREGPYAIPFTDVPKTITNLTAEYAGVLLYDARRITDEGEDVDEVTFHRRQVEKTIAQIHSRQLKFNLDTTYTTHPKMLD